MPPLTPANALIRSQNVTASEVAALMPCGHPYITPADIYDRIALGEESKDSQAMRIGSALEDSVLRFAQSEIGFEAVPNDKTLVHPWARLAATPDAWLLSRWPSALQMENALIEVKVSGRAELWQDIPPHVDWQCRAQMAVTNRDVVYIVVLVAMRLLSFPVYRAPDQETELLDRVQRFWADHIEAGVRPSESAPAAIQTFSFEADTPQREAITP